jgi:hypothetical protein
VALDYTHDAIVVAFRGTDTSDPASVAAEATAPAEPLPDLCAGCWGSSGTYYSWVSVRDVVLSRVLEALAEEPSYRVVVTGHSLGGAIATVAAFELRNNPNIAAPVDLVGSLNNSSTIQLTIPTRLPSVLHVLVTRISLIFLKIKRVYETLKTTVLLISVTPYQTHHQQMDSPKVSQITLSNLEMMPSPDQWISM